MLATSTWGALAGATCAQGRRNVASRGGAEMREKGIPLSKGLSKRKLVIFYLGSVENIQYTQHYRNLRRTTDHIKIYRGQTGLRSLGADADGEGGGGGRAPLTSPRWH